MADSPRRGFILASLILALLAAGVAAVLAAVYLTSPLDDPTLSAQVAVEASAGDVVLAALVAVALSALIIATLYASWRPHLRIAAYLTCAALMTAAGLLAALTLDPASADLQARFGVYSHGEGRDLLLALFAPWVERMAALTWLYAACGAALLALTLVAALASRREQQVRGGDHPSGGARESDGAGGAARRDLRTAREVARIQADQVPDLLPQRGDGRARWRAGGGGPLRARRDR